MPMEVKCTHLLWRSLEVQPALHSAAVKVPGQWGQWDFPVQGSQLPLILNSRPSLQIVVFD